MSELIKVVWNFLIKNNLLPYLAIFVLGYFSLNLWESNIQKEIELQKAKLNQQFTEESMGLIQIYNMERFEELEKIKETSVWKEGKHEKLFP